MDASQAKKRGIIKFIFWAAASVAVITGCAYSYTSGQMVEWFYHRAAIDGYAVNADTIHQGTKQNPSVLAIQAADQINGMVAVKVQKGDRLPRNANGVIDAKVLKEGRRAALDANQIRVMVPWEIKEAKGFKYKDTFKHKGIETWPWSGVWNVVFVGLLGLCLGLMAEGFTDMLGIKLEKIQHHVGH